MNPELFRGMLAAVAAEAVRSARVLPTEPAIPEELVRNAMHRALSQAGYRVDVGARYPQAAADTCDFRLQNGCASHNAWIEVASHHVRPSEVAAPSAAFSTWGRDIENLSKLARDAGEPWFLLFCFQQRDEQACSAPGTEVFGTPDMELSIERSPLFVWRGCPVEAIVLTGWRIDKMPAKIGFVASEGEPAAIAAGHR
jgi:hypothetical protein